MVDWASKYVPPTSHPHVLEVGSGNGTLLLALVDAGFDASKLAGVDYSPDAVKLAQMIASTRNGELVSFSVCDFLTEVPPPPSKTTDAWDLILDKGTYDAIALGEKDADGRSPASGYPVRVSNLLKENGFFLITSCNFTEEELKKNFITLETGLKYHSRINHPTISFGGKSGSVYATVAFQKI
ncbi:S-adenosyl-L-methionine-dependent methyltransferase [Artomyces pyxidatus]|uniref:S-adenosyl-L-methionine-dependent methyltransferase n=1 Tax=Artomyces pyxidatus TaxID=48021 RepID=A0ACB8TA51_9AGAM|nr:S-adenosyl-L-methionine-dependent methyltransferase [Artomyces pyxidatus]